MTTKNQLQSFSLRKYRIKYTAIFFILGIIIISIGIVIGNVGWLLTWPGISFVILGTGYGWFGAKVFGKHQDGTMAWWAMMLLLPYLLLTWLTWSIQRHTKPSERFNEIVSGIWLGRRVYDHELPTNIGLIVDLSVEFPEHKAVAARRGYTSLPTLDELPPEIEELQVIIDMIKNSPENVYIHCVSGQGRSATLVAVFLLAQGLAESPEDAIAKMKAKRPSVRLSHAQRSFLASFDAFQ